LSKKESNFDSKYRTFCTRNSQYLTRVPVSLLKLILKWTAQFSSYQVSIFIYDDDDDDDDDDSESNKPNGGMR
jgi:hypothetical protein